MPSEWAQRDKVQKKKFCRPGIANLLANQLRISLSYTWHQNRYNTSLLLLINVLEIY